MHSALNGQQGQQETNFVEKLAEKGLLLCYKRNIKFRSKVRLNLVYLISLDSL